MPRRAVALGLALLHACAALNLAGTTVRLSLNVGREPGTWMPDDWAASGARLLLPVDVRFDERECESEPFIGKIRDGARELTPLDDARFVGMDGEQRVPVARGGYCATPSPGRSGEACLRFWLDFPEGAQKRDVYIAPGERVFFNTGAWDADALAAFEAEVTMKQAAYDELCAEVERETAALAEAPAWERLFMTRKMILLQERRQNLKDALAYAKATLPERTEGAEPTGGLRFATEGGLCVKRKKGFLGPEVYHILGTFRVSDVRNAEATEEPAASTAV